jgi:hypothetical protein
MLEPHHKEVGSVDRVDRSGLEDARPLGDLQITRKPARLRFPPLDALVVFGVDAQDPSRPVAEVEHEREVEGDEVAEVGPIETPRRVREADVAHRAGHVRPPGVDGPAGEPKVGGKVAEEVDGQRRRPEEVGPQSLVIEALVRFRDGRSGPRRVECAGGEEIRARLSGVGQRETASDQAH